MNKKESENTGYVYVYSDEEELLIRMLPNESLATKKKSIVEQIWSNIDNFKDRGQHCVKPELIARWEKLIDKSLSSFNLAWYSGSAIDAALQCMEKLNDNSSVEDVYSLIDFESSDEACIFFDKALSYNQKLQVARVVEQYHPRGEEFIEYINAKYGLKQKVRKTKWHNSIRKNN